VYKNKGDYAGFVSAQALRRGRTLPMAGAIVDDTGAVIGRHDGTHQFTIGQHRGLGNLAVRDKLYVTAIDPMRGEVRVGPKETAERRELAIRDLRWLSPVRDRCRGGAGPLSRDARRRRNHRRRRPRQGEPRTRPSPPRPGCSPMTRSRAGGRVAADITQSISPASVRNAEETPRKLPLRSRPVRS
jgi:hypothetical protein